MNGVTPIKTRNESCVSIGGVHGVQADEREREREREREKTMVEGERI